MIKESGTAYGKLFGDAGLAYQLLKQQILNSQSTSS